MKNKMGDLNNHLFACLERLNNEELTDEELDREVKRSKSAVKIAEPNQWALKHRLIYERAFGAVPRDKIIIFLDGNKLNFNIDNLKMITRKQNSFLNKQKLRFDNPELTMIGINISAVLEKCLEVKKEAR